MVLLIMIFGIGIVHFQLMLYQKMESYIIQFGVKIIFVNFVTLSLNLQRTSYFHAPTNQRQ
jgi:hypothetical protein